VTSRLGTGKSLTFLYSVEILIDLSIRDIKYLYKPEIIRLTPAFVNFLDTCRIHLSFCGWKQARSGKYKDGTLLFLG
jgi:hypothetical protein